MNEPLRIQKLRRFKKKFHHALSITDPLDYAVRQRDLVYQICDFLLDELFEYEEKEKNKSLDFLTEKEIKQHSLEES